MTRSSQNNKTKNILKSSKIAENTIDPIKLQIRNLQYLRVKNFKQFVGNKKIGPFENFNALVGANGAGKSSIFEAIGFVLGLRHKKFKKENIEELRSFGLKSSEEFYVEMICLGTQGDTIMIKRRIKDGKDSFYLNSKELEKSDYRCFLTNSNLDPLIGSFWLNQNMMDELCMKSGVELRKFFEVISGSVQYKKEFDEKNDALTKIQDELNDNKERLKNIRKQLKDSQGHIKNGDMYKKISDDYDELTLAKIQAHLLELEIRKEEAIKRGQQIEKMIKMKEKESQAQTKKLRELMSSNSENTNLDSLIAERDQKKRQIGSLHERKYNKKINYQENKSNTETVNITIGILKKNLEECQKNKKQLENEISEAQKQLVNMDYVNKFKGKLKTVVSDYVTTMRERTQFEEQKLNSQLKSLKQTISEKENSIDSLKAELEQKINNLVIVKRQKTSKESELQEIQLRRDQIQKNKEELETKYKDFSKEEIQGWKNELITIETLQEQLRGRISDGNSQRELSNHLFENVSGFKGILGDLVKPIDDRFRLARSILLGKAKHYLVVEDQKSALLVNDILRERFSQQTVIILESLPAVSKAKISDFRKKVAQFGTPAFDIVYADDENIFIEKAIHYFLMGKVCCENMKKAQKVRELFQKNTNVVTIKGQQIKGNCMSNIGDSKQLMIDEETRKQIDERLFDLEKKKEVIQNQLKDYINQEDEKNLENLSKRLNQFEMLKKKVQNDKEMADDRIQKLTREKTEIENQVKIMEREIKDLSSTINPLEARYDTLKNKRVKEEENILKEIFAKENLSSEKSKISQILECLDQDIESRYNIQQKIIDLGGKAVNLNIEGKITEIEELNEKQKEFISRDKEINKEILEIDEQIIKEEDSLEKMNLEISKIEKELNKNKSDDIGIRRTLRMLGDEIDALRAEDRRISAQKDHCESKHQQMQQEIEIEGHDIPKTETGEYDYTILTKRISNGNDGIILEELEDVDSKSNLKAILSGLSATNLRKQMATIYEESSKEMNKHCSKFFSSEFINKENSKKINLQSELKKLVDQQKELFNDHEHTREQLEKIRNLRNEKFMSLVIKVQTEVNEMYYMLTGDRAAHAKLYVLSPNDPTSGALRYEPTPPQKKFVFDATTLSGGEIVVASLALFFSINQAIKAPFVLLDEADAPFDSVNASIYGTCLNKFSKKTQILIISHNFNVFSKVGMLLGVALGSKEQGASCFSYKLKGSDEQLILPTFKYFIENQQKSENYAKCGYQIFQLPDQLHVYKIQNIYGMVQKLFLKKQERQNQSPNLEKKWKMNVPISSLIFKLQTKTPYFYTKNIKIFILLHFRYGQINIKYRLKFLQRAGFYFAAKQFNFHILQLSNFIHIKN